MAYRALIRIQGVLMLSQKYQFLLLMVLLAGDVVVVVHVQGDDGDYPGVGLCLIFQSVLRNGTSGPLRNLTVD